MAVDDAEYGQALAGYAQPVVAEPGRKVHVTHSTGLF